MDLLAQLFAGTPEPTADFWYQPTPGQMTAAGMRIDADSAQKISAWFRGRNILATSLAMLPFKLYERLPNDGGSNVAHSHQLHDAIHRKPNPDGAGDAFTWKTQAMYDLIDHGWAYDWVSVGAKWSLQRIDPLFVKPELVKRGPSKGRMLFHIRDEFSGVTTTYTQDEVFYRMANGGKGILDCARESLGLARVTEAYAGKVFGQGTLNGGIIEVPGPMDEESARAMAKSFVTAAGEWFMPKVLPQAAKWLAQDGMTPDKAQMLLSRKFSINDIARWLGLPPHMIGDLERSTNNNIEHQGQEFVTYSLGPWLSLWEFAVNDQLILQPNRFYAEFTRDALVRGDIATRWAAHVAAVNGGIKSVDEVRGAEGLNKRGGKADELREPQNITGKPTVAGAPKPADEDDEPEEIEDEAREPSRAELIAVATAASMLRIESMAIIEAAQKHTGEAFGAWLGRFYAPAAKHAQRLQQRLMMSPGAAAHYCAHQRDQVREHGLSVLSTWEADSYAARLAAIALDEVAA